MGLRFYYLICTAFPLKEWLRKRTLRLGYTYIACFVVLSSYIICISMVAY
jgi:hypothetical protein